MRIIDHCYITIQSANRPEQVEPMLDALYPTIPVWYVPTDQAETYKSHGATVIPVDGELPMKPKQLNAALADGFAKDLIVITMDDDYVSSEKLVVVEGRNKSEPISLVEMIETLATDLVLSPWFLAGIAGTTNPFWAQQTNTDYGMVTGQILAHKPNPVRFDESLPMLEDLDYILEHHKAYGGLSKNRSLLPEFHIFGRSAKSDSRYSGGYKNYRTEKVQAETLNQLAAKHREPEIVFNNQGLGKSVQNKIQFRKLAYRFRT